MTEFVSFRAENGRIATCSKEFAEANGLKALDPKKYPPVDGNGHPLAEREDDSKEATR